MVAANPNFDDFSNLDGAQPPPSRTATYGQIQVYCRSNYGFIPQTCWIADVLADLGMTSRQAPNRKDALQPTKPCPPDRRMAIFEAIERAGRSERHSLRR